MYERHEKHRNKVLVITVNERVYLGELGIVGRIILKLILKKYGLIMCI
jgi:hypothetical protein